MLTLKDNLVAFFPAVSLAFVLVATAPVSKAQQTGKCSFCQYVSREGQWSGKRVAGDVFETCSTEGSECPFECVTHVGCGGAITASSPLAGCTGSPATTKLVSEISRQTESERRNAEDVKIREDLLKTGGAAVLIDPQLKGPVMMTQGKHTSKDLLASAQILNMSDKPVAAVESDGL